jgi:Cu(I)/Ag(I) efflux system membrane protein CusA/SilA
LLIVGAGLFPLDAVLGIEWRTCFLATVGVTMFFTILFIVGTRWQLLAFVSLGCLALVASHFPRIGTDYMPVLDEGSILDMPVTVPRASVTEATDDLKARDALLRRFPEVEMIVGKAGRADTPTDPSPQDMVESVITLRPKEFWPKRKLEYKDAEKQMALVLAALQDRGLIGPIGQQSERRAMLDSATMNATSRMDEAMRELALRQFSEFEAALGPKLLREFIVELVGRWQKAGRLLGEKGTGPISRNGPEGALQKSDVSPFLLRLTESMEKDFASILSAGAAQEDVNRLVQRIAERLAAEKRVKLDPDLLTAKYGPLYEAYLTLSGTLGVERPTLMTDMWDFLEKRRDRHWREATGQFDRQIFDQAVAAYDRYAIEELRKLADEKGLWKKGGRGKGEGGAANSSAPNRASSLPSAFRLSPSPFLSSLRVELDAAWAPHLFLWKKSKEDLLKEMDSVVRMPGWANIWTQPIINRIDMLATGVRTMIGVKIFGNDLDQIQTVTDRVAEVVRQIPGAVDVVPDQIRGKGYLEIKIDRDRAARYGVRVGDIQDVIETALGGKAITMTVEGRERFPVRIRYARDFRADEEEVKNLLVSAAAPMAQGGAGMTEQRPAPASASGSKSVPVQIPLAMVADVKIVEGPAMIKSENGMLRSYVQLNVRDRDIVGFVEEAQRAVAQKVKLPPGMYLAWSGQFENQVRARQTMQIVFPAVALVIFIILYLTYNDFADAVLMMMCVPEALVGGAILLWLTQYHFLGLPETRFSVAVQVGFIACFGMATETGIIMLVYLREALEKRGGLEKIQSLAELQRAVIEGAVHRLRPKLLTEGVAIIALAPMLWATGVGHEVISAMAVPVLGGLLIADEVVDIFIPVRFYWVRRHRWLKMHNNISPPSW